MKKQLIQFPVNRLQSESDKAWKAFRDYCELGNGRSIAGLHSLYKGAETPRKPPTQSLDTLKGWSANHDWVERSAEYDAIQENERLRRLREEAELKWREDVEKCRQRRYDTAVILGDLVLRSAGIFKVKLWGDHSDDPERQALIEKYQHISLDQAIRIVSSLPRLFEVGSRAEFEALQIRHLLNELDG